jgi:hypothetical protein
VPTPDQRERPAAHPAHFQQQKLYMNNKNVIGGGQSVLTGPSFIDSKNIDTIAELAKGGTH